MADLTSLTVAEMRAQLLSGTITAEELIDSHLRRLHDTAEINSFITVCDEESRTLAKDAQVILNNMGDKSPVLTGIPVGIKDQLLTQGVKTTCGSKMLGDFVPPYDCTAVARLKEAGAILLGKTNQDEFAMGSSNEFSSYGPVKNPWNTAKVPGGSSGGSAAAVAAGQVPVSLGTDTGGSIRQPAGLCGVYGLKPTYGRVSRYGAVAFASSLDQIGPFARSVQDLAQITHIIAGKDPCDATSVSSAVPDYAESIRMWSEKGLQGVRVGVPSSSRAEGVHADVLEAFDQAIAVCSALGAEIVEIELPHADFALAAYYITAPAEASSNLARFDGIRYGYRTESFASLDELYARTRAEGFGPEVKRRIMVGSYVLSAGYYDAYYKKAQQLRTLIINDYAMAFANLCDVVLTPVSPTTAFSIGERTQDPLTMYMADIFTVPINLAGLPGVSLPFSLSQEGLPIGIQFVGPSFSEELLFGLSAIIEKDVNFPVARHTSGVLEGGAS